MMTASSNNTHEVRLLITVPGLPGILETFPLKCHQDLEYFIADKLMHSTAIVNDNGIRTTCNLASSSTNHIVDTLLKEVNMFRDIIKLGFILSISSVRIIGKTDVLLTFIRQQE